ncbi:cytochrome b5 isoform X2 [Bradysia coprophila]|uniref:cytochrome b5 isoform X2 n=1 Tax=Bradysia coprophila TaxID=38358 RepID=UPI00187DB34A|nr:cytochrome b5 isoform X2 [Bradysia coprophila]
MSTAKKYTFAEVKEHNKPSDLWVVIHDKVYDVTKFLHEHPGGEEVLEESAGRNATKDFDDADHSESAKEQLANYYLGDIVDEEKTEKSVSKKAASSNSNSGSNKGLCLAGISALAIALGSIVLYKGFQMSKSSN